MGVGWRIRAVLEAEVVADRWCTSKDTITTRVQSMSPSVLVGPGGIRSKIGMVHLHHLGALSLWVVEVEVSHHLDVLGEVAAVLAVVGLKLRQAASHSPIVGRHRPSTSRSVGTRPPSRT